MAKKEDFDGMLKGKLKRKGSPTGNLLDVVQSGRKPNTENAAGLYQPAGSLKDVQLRKKVKKPAKPAQNPQKQINAELLKRIHIVIKNQNQHFTKAQENPLAATEQDEKESEVAVILIADPKQNDFMSQKVFSSMNKLDAYSGNDFDIYCPGYYIEEEKNAAEKKNAVFKFYTDDYESFVKEMESKTDWKKKTGGALSQAHLLIARFVDGELNFDQTYDLNLTEIRKEGLIGQTDEDANLFIAKILEGLRMDSLGEGDINQHIGKQRRKEHFKNIVTHAREAKTDNLVSLKAILPNLVVAIEAIIKSKKINKYFIPHNMTKSEGGTVTPPKPLSRKERRLEKKAAQKKDAVLE